MIKIDSNTYINYNAETSTAEVIKKDALEIELQDAIKRLSEIPEEITDEELLAWARINYIATDYSVEKENLKSIIENNEKLLGEM